MKFNCGESREVRVRKHNRQMLEKAKNLREEWHEVFAWLPVRVDESDCRWLEKVERRYPGAYVATSVGVHVEDVLEEWDWKTKVHSGFVVEHRALGST